MADADSSIILIATFISHQENIEWMIKKKAFDAWKVALYVN